MGPEFQRLLRHEEDRRIASHRTASSVVIVAPTTAIIACDVAVDYNELIPTFKFPRLGRKFCSDQDQEGQGGF